MSRVTGTGVGVGRSRFAWLLHPPLFRTATFRLTIGSSAILAGALLVQSGLIFLQTTTFETARTDLLLRREVGVLALRSKPQLGQSLRMSESANLHLLITAAGLFDPTGHPLSGNLAVWPAGLALDGRVHALVVRPTDEAPQRVRALAATLPDGDVLVLARSVRDLDELRAILGRALALSALPALLLAALGGIWFSHRALQRVGVMGRAIERIMEGDLHERLPAGRAPAGGDDLDRLAASVNRMLGRLEHLMDEIKGVGDDIAHDLRTPLARVRRHLERARGEAVEGSSSSLSLDRAAADLDQCFRIITALLRIGEIENGRRRAAFASVRLDEIVADIVDLYEPIAESREVSLRAPTGVDGVAVDGVAVHGDRDLLIELAANLIDNAIKFTPPGGHVEVGVTTEAGGAAGTLWVRDSGIGIAPEERDAVLGRFYRADKSRHVEGSGLGLSLVAAIARLHGATLRICEAEPGAEPPGCRFEVGFAGDIALPGSSTGAS